MRVKGVVGITALLAVFALGACGGGGGGGNDTTEKAGESTTLSVNAKEFSFDNTSLTANAGSVEIALKNTGVVEHDFSIEGSDFIVHAKAGASATGRTSLTAGTYTYFCSVPGHRQQGMQGTLTVA